MTDTAPELPSWSCPLPSSRYDRVLLGHGSGGTLSHDLLHRVFLPAFHNDILALLEDQATVSWPGDTPAGTRLAVTTDAFVVRPLFFPGGDIGSLSVYGTVNDLAVGGAEPLYLTASFILEEGLPLTDLQRVVASMRAACQRAGVTLIAGDTKVVDRGHCDQLFISTTGVGRVPPGRTLSIHAAQPGDALVISGTVGDHGIAILSVREGLAFETVLESDAAPLTDLVQTLLAACPRLRGMRDPTRGGLTSTLHELAVAAQVGVELEESAIPIRHEVQAACEMLGLDPLYVANEGKLLAVVPAEDAALVVEVMRQHPLGRDAAIIGRVVAEHPGLITLRTRIGGERIVTMLSGEQLPRIC